MTDGKQRFAPRDYLKKGEGARFEGECVAAYKSRAGVPMVVIEIVGGPFAGMQHIYREEQVSLGEPSRWFSLFADAGDR